LAGRHAGENLENVHAIASTPAAMPGKSHTTRRAATMRNSSCNNIDFETGKPHNNGTIARPYELPAKTMPVLSRPKASVALFAVCFLAGCGPDPLDSVTAQRLKALSGMYLTHAVAKNGGGPASEEAMKKYLKNVEAIALQNNGIDPKAIDSIFVSERDQQPFVVLYGKSIMQVSGESKEPLAYEKTGKNGKVLVAYTNTKVDHVSEAQLKELLAAKKPDSPK
jgi:hypothetical protein